MSIRSFSALSLLLSSTVGCADAEQIAPPNASAVSHTVSFVGFVYDGADGSRLTSYTVDAQAGTAITNGTLEEGGRYSLGNISVWDDFTITIGIDGYRDFRSHNRHRGLPSEFTTSDSIDGVSTHQTAHFDAYLFPESLVASKVTLNIDTGLDSQPAAGKIRLRPISASALVDTTSEAPGGVPGQVWSNDEDLQSRTLNLDFTAGEAVIAAGELAYGVSYLVNVFEVPGFQPFEATLRAGFDASRTFNLIEESAEPVKITNLGGLTCSVPGSVNDTQSAVVAIQFNHDIEFVDSGYAGGAVELLDDFFSISSTNTNGDGVVNALQSDASDQAQERGVSAVISGKTLTLSWNPSVGLATKDPADTFNNVTYSGLSSIQMRRLNAPSSAVTLSVLLGSSTLSCQ